MHIKFPTKDSAKQGYEDGLKGVVKSIGEHDPVDHAYHEAHAKGEYDSKKKVTDNGKGYKNLTHKQETTSSLTGVPYSERPREEGDYRSKKFGET